MSEIACTAEYLAGWDISGPHFKDADHYLSSDGDNPEAAWPGYGWPLDSECWYFFMEGHGLLLYATGVTIATALRRVHDIAKREMVELLEHEAPFSAPHLLA